MDFALPPRPVKMRLISGRGHYDAVIGAVQRATRSVWVATANLKEMMVEGRRLSARDRGRYRSILEVFDELAAAGVELRILHASRPSGPFRERFDRLPRLYQGGVELRECPRVHLKTVIVDGALCYLGSANWTGAGLGAKGEGRRNFEVGMITDDDGVLDTIQEIYDRIWRGAECAACRLRDEGCEAPLDLFDPRRLASRVRRRGGVAREREVVDAAEGVVAEASAGAAKRSAAKKATAKKATAARRSAAKRATAKKATAKKAAAKKAAAKKATAAKRSAAKKSTAKKATAKKTTAKRASAAEAEDMGT